MPQPPSSGSTAGPKLVLRLRGLGHVPNFKNSKLLIGGRNGRPPRQITKPEYQELMEKATDAFEFQLRSWLATTGLATGTEPLSPSLIASLLPLDDCLAWIGSHSVNWRRVRPGEEGAVLVIQPL